MSDDQPKEGTDTGAPFVPGKAPDVAEKVIEPPKLPTTDVIAAMLRAGSGKANEIAGERAKCNLQLTAWEARMIAPGIRRYLEARPALAATMAAGGNEYLMAGVGMTWAGGRMALERHRKLAAELEAEEAAADAATAPDTPPWTAVVPDDVAPSPALDVSDPRD